MIKNAPTAPFGAPSWMIWFQDLVSALRFLGRSYPVSSLPPTAYLGAITFASNGRKDAEGDGTGTGVPVWFDGTVWRTFYDNSQVAE